MCDGNEGVVYITEASQLNCLLLSPGHSLGESYPSSEMYSVYSTTPADWARLMFNWIVSVTLQYLEPFNFVDLFQIELLEL